jgi:hypothetical protein
VNERQPAGELTLAYEALRGQATGELHAATPRGLALFLAAGFPTWMKAWAPLAPLPIKAPRAVENDCNPPSGIEGEVVQLLAEMALNQQKKWATL